MLGRELLALLDRRLERIARPRTFHRSLAIRAFIAGVFFCLLPAIALAQMPPAGTDVTNQATSIYEIDPSQLQAFSNVCVNRVLPVYLIGLSPPGTVASPAFSLTGAGGDTLYCAFDLTNFGNDHDSVAVSYALVPPSNTTIADIIFFDDADGNGRYDPGEEDPSFLAIDAGLTIPMATAVILPAGNFGGDAFIEVRAVSTNDTTSTVETSVILVRNTSPPQMTLFLGPRGNPHALPGGEGSGDDLTVGYLDYLATSFTFENDVLNDGTSVDFYEVSLGDSTALPAGVGVAFADSAGQQLPQSPTAASSYLIGAVGPGEVCPLRVRVFSVTRPLSGLLSGPVSLQIRARSTADTLQQNTTTDELIPPQQFNPAAVLSVNQAFHERTASIGDVVTLLITAQNITDNIRVDSVAVEDWVQPKLDFVSSPHFTREEGRFVWRVGTLTGGQSKTAVIKFVANGRVTSGVAKAAGNINGVAETGDAVWAGPAVSTIRLEPDEFASEGVVLGEVYIDENGNERRDRGERGVADIAVFLDSGEYAVTDSLGRFTLPEAFAGWRTVRLDEQTVPNDLEFFEPLGGRDGGPRDNERLVHMVRGGNAYVSFRLRRVEKQQPVMVEHVVTCQELVSLTRFARLYQAFVLPSSHFGLARAEPRVDIAKQLRPVVEFLNEHPDWGVFLEGHTDNIPINTEEFPSNAELSVARAKAVRLHLVSMGIATNRIAVYGHGESRPRATNETIEGRRLNRRVEVSLIPPGVDVEDDSLHRTKVAGKDLSALPDTFKVTVRWELATSCGRPTDAALRIRLPDRFKDARIRVTMDGTAVVLQNGVYHLREFSKSRTARCELEFRSANNELAFVNDVEASVEVEQPSPGAVPIKATDFASTANKTRRGMSEPQKHKKKTVRIRPYTNGEVGNEGRTHKIHSWKEVVSEPAAGADGNSGTSGESLAAISTGRSQDVPKVESTFAIIEPLPDQVFSRTDQIRVRARVPLSSKTTVLVGGEQLPDRHLGQKDVHVKEKFEEITWYAVRIQPGWNTITLQAILLDGSTRTDSVLVALTSRPAMLEAQRKRVLVAADGHSSEIVRFEVRDALGLRAADGIVATVVDGGSIVANDDARPDTPGFQIVSQSGFFSLQVRPAAEARRYDLAVECAGMRAACEVSYVTAVRPMMAAGVVDFRLGVHKTGGNGSPEGLENYDDGVSADAEARVFLQRSLPHGVGVTARLDTEKRYEDPHLKQIDPDRQYPVYGDASERHFAAPSRTGNYVSVDKGESFLRYGDFKTPFTDGEYLYFHQVATGVTGAIVGDEGALSGFVTDSDHATFRDEIRADGTSGFYYLSRSPVVENSERLFLETRDRFQSEDVLDMKPLVRNRDYTINPLDGSILFKEPVPVTDPQFNPVFIVAVYQVETNDESRYLIGVRGDLTRDRRYRVGATAVANSGEGEDYALYGLDGQLDVAGIKVGGEFARNEDDVMGGGNAYRIEAGVTKKIAEAKVYFRRVDEGFNNPSFLRGTQEVGTRKAGFKSRLRMSEDISLHADGYLHDLRKTDEKRANVLGGGSYRHRLFEFFAGGRVANQNDNDGDHTGILTVLGLSANIPRRVELRSRWEKNLGDESVDNYPDRLKTTLAVPLGKKLRLSASHEYLTSSGRPGTNQFLTGLESQLSSRTTAYTRYRMNRTASDGRMGALAGIRQAFGLRDGLRGTLAIEAFQSMSDGDDDEYVSLKTGLNTRRAKSHLIETRYEYRWQRTRSKHTMQFIASTQLKAGFSLLLNDVISFAPDDERKTGVSYRGKLGLAYRPIGLPLQSLLALKNTYEKYTPVNPEAVTWKVVVSADVNVLPAVNHELRFKYAHKRVEDFSYGISIDSDADLALGQYIYRFARNWDIDVWGRMVLLHGGTLETGTGIELGRLFLRSLRVAAGYSANGFDELGVSGNDAWSRGFGVRIQLILSDWIMQEFGSK